MDANRPAFPQTLTFTQQGEGVCIGQYFDEKEGVTIRAYIATKALAAMISNPNCHVALKDGEEFDATLCKYSVAIADGLIAELSKS